MFEEFATYYAFHKGDGTINRQSSSAFDSEAFLRVTKVLFEGQTRKLPALMILKSVFPSKLGNEEFANYLKVTKG